jgi:hypothetical protein
MNKTLLIIICDFLLLSLLSLASFDKAAESQPPAPERAEDQTTSRDDLMDALQTALEQEQQTREQLQSQLEQTRDQAKTREQLLAEREASLRALQQNLKLTEEQARLLDQERKALDEQVYASVRSIVDLEKQLTDASVQTQVSQARLDALGAELRMREREAERLQNQLSTVEERQKAAEAEKQQLAVLVTREQVAVVQQEKQQIQQEKAVIQEHAKVLAEGVSSLAEKSGELRQEIREHRPLTGNLILSSFFTNRVDAEFTAGRSGLLGQSGNSRSTKTVLVSSGGQVYALYHAQDTLLNVAAGATDWNYLFGNLRRGFALVSLESLSFLQADPRIILAPISADQAKELGVAVYPLAKEPFKFNEAVLVGGTEGYYGEAPFQLDPATPKHVRMQRERFSKLFGKFSPSRGDLVFSKTGEVLGIMANGEYCLVLDDLTVGGTVTLGATIQSEANKRMLANMGFRTSQLPLQVR